jgi:hypothetical protein
MIQIDKFNYNCNEINMDYTFFNDKSPKKLKLSKSNNKINLNIVISNKAFQRR